MRNTPMFMLVKVIVFNLVGIFAGKKCVTHLCMSIKANAFILVDIFARKKCITHICMLV